MKAGVPVSEEVKYDYEKINKYYVRSCHKGVHYFRFIVNYMWNAGGEVENILIIWVENTLIHKALLPEQYFCSPDQKLAELNIASPNDILHLS